MKRVFRVLAVLSSVSLLVLYVFYRANTKAGDDLRRATAMPSSKIGTAVEIYQVDWDGVYPQTGAATQTNQTDNTDYYLITAPGSKSTQVFVPESSDSAASINDLIETP